MLAPPPPPATTSASTCVTPAGTVHKLVVLNFCTTTAAFDTEEI